MSDLISRYENIKMNLKGAIVKGYEKYDFASLLSIQIWKFITKPKLLLIPRIFSMIICKKVELVDYVDKKSIFTSLNFIDSDIIRPDNETIYNNAKFFLEPCNEIIIRRCNKISFVNIKNKILLLINGMKSFKKVDSIIGRLYFAASISIIFDLESIVENLDSFNKSRILMVFQDHEIIENILVQKVKNNGGKTISLQHGQRFYRKCDADYMGIENFISDYTLLWNKFSVIQYKKAGFSEERLPVVGSTKYALDNSKKVKISNRNNEIKKIGVILDVPHNISSENSNENMIKMALDFAENHGYRVIIKPHPTDINEKYKKYEKRKCCEKITEPFMSMKEFSDGIEFAILHTSGAVVDLIINSIPVFIYKNEIEFPIEIDSIYLFHDYNEMEKNMLQWIDNKMIYLKEFGKIRDLYYVQNSHELHKGFFEKLKNNIIKG